MHKHLYWLFVILPLFAEAQDPQFSQYYANPLYLNPALTGNIASARAGVSYRRQWPAIDANFDTYTVYYDQYLPDVNSAVGLLLMHDRQGVAGLNSTSAHANYVYQMPLSNGLTVRPGISLGVFQRAVNTDNLKWGDQFDGSGFSGITSEDLSNYDPVYQFDLSLGGLVYTPFWWAGASWSHINEPAYTFIDQPSDLAKLPYKISVHGGYRIALPADEIRVGLDKFGRERSITPTFEFKYQNAFRQLSLGGYLTWEPLVVGLWYRGIPIGSNEVKNRSESAILMIGLLRSRYSIGYSFDYTLSSLRIATGGAHEVTFAYQFKMGNPKKPPYNKRQVPCPDF